MEPNDHDTLASTATTAGHKGSALVAFGCSSSASPAKPSSMPATASRVGRSRPHAKAMIAIHTGDIESKSDVIPVGRYCTLHAVVPLPISSRLAPVTAARTRSPRDARPRPRRMQIAYRTAPASRKRIDTIANGGIDPSA